jgi:hypothetical protein
MTPTEDPPPTYLLTAEAARESPLQAALESGITKAQWDAVRYPQQRRGSFAAT